MARGMTLIELLVGLAVASLVAIVATTGLSATGMAMQKHGNASRTSDAAWMALDAIVADLRRADSWQMCTEARDCRQRPGKRKRYNVPMLVVGDVEWLVQGGLRRCAESCDEFIEGVIRMDVVADIPTKGGLNARGPLYERHGTTPATIEVILTMADRRRFSRVVRRVPDITQEDGRADAVTQQRTTEG